MMSSKAEELRRFTDWKGGDNMQMLAKIMGGVLVALCLWYLLLLMKNNRNKL